MSTSKGANTYNRQNWEESEFPILCETCLGDNQMLRMTKEKFGKECKICKRPFTVFRWQAGTRGRYKKTEICQVCAKAKNVCQTCILDLQFGLPVEARDHALRIKQNLPRGAVNREYNQQMLENELENSSDPLALYAGIEATSSAGGKMLKTNDMLLKMARTEPYYKRNRPHICSFFAKGNCKRGEECPYRHERPTDPEDPMSQQNIGDRYYGVNDPVASNLLDKCKKTPRPTPPEDRSVTTLHLGGVSEESSITEQSIRSAMYHYGEIRTVSLHKRQKCAFVQFATRDAAERAIDRCYDKLIICGTRLSVNWGKPQTPREASDSLQILPAIPGLPHFTQLPPQMPMLWPGGLPPSSVPPPPPPPPIDTANIHTTNDIHRIHYPSQDPNRMGGVKR